MMEQTISYSLILTKDQADYLSASKQGINRMQALVSLINLTRTAEEAYEKKDADACERYNNELMTAFQAASSAMYGQAGGQQGGNPFNGQNGPFGGQAGPFGGQGGQQNGGNSNNGPQDVDFEEVK